MTPTTNPAVPSRPSGSWPVLVAVLLALSGGWWVEEAEGIQLSRTLGHNMVLQRAPASARIYGFGTAGDTGRVLFNKNSLNFTVDGAGHWVVSLPPTPAGGPYNLTVESNTEGTLLIDNVLFGDVWFCGGQSNMGIPVGYALNASAEIQAMTVANFPTIRIFHVSSNYFSYQPFSDLEPGQVGLTWQPVSPSTGQGFSAVCWFFGRDYYLDNGKQIPVGLIQNQWGGTPVEAWSSPDAVAKCPNISSAYTPHKSSGKRGEEAEVAFPTLGSGSQGDPSVLWNSMVVPYLSMKLAGWTWYQGEQNTGSGSSPFHGPKYYACAFPAMIADWRAKFQLADAPFLFVQLAPWCFGTANCTTNSPSFKRDGNIPDLRLSQMAALQLPRVGWAIADDLGDMAPPAGSVHPRNKQPVGRRLAAAARHFLFDATVDFGGPLASAAKATGVSTVVVTVATSALPLQLVPDLACPEGIQDTFCNGAGFEVSADADGATWVPAASVQLGPSPTEITVQAKTTATPKWIRYKYIDWPLSTVVDAKGFPMSVSFLAVN